MGAQNGFAILFTVRNQDNTAPWSVVEDVTFSDNLIRNVANGFNLLGYDDNYRSQQTKRIHIYNNLITGLGEGGQGTMLQMLDGTAGVQVQQNTVMNRGNLMMAEGRSHVGFVFSSNIAMHGEYGMIGTGTASVQDTLARYFTEPELRGNVIVGAAPNQYPEDNTTARNVAALDFVDVNAGNFRLSERSRFSAARSAGASGADIDRLCNALSSVDRHMFCAAPVAP
jgi:hypothetical protein